MAPPDPPPYTQEQINAMTSNTDKIRARAELLSYIARLKKEKQEREAQAAINYSPANFTAPEPNGYSPGGNNNFTVGERPRIPSQGFRGNYRGRGRGYRQYTPYQRPQPQHRTPNFQNNSVTFNQELTSDEPLKDNVSSIGTSRASLDTHAKHSDQAHTSPTTLCPALTSTGQCRRSGCPHLHDADKKALCTHWLYKGDCLNKFCLLSHEPTPNNSPTCLHFQSGSCTKENCRFAHIHLNSAALNCDAFGRLGYCEKGNDCAEVHAHECPTFSNTGKCLLGDKCTLRHVHRTSRLRTTVRRSSDSPSADVQQQHDISENVGEVVITGREGNTEDSHSISQQADFIPLGSN